MLKGAIESESARRIEIRPADCFLDNFVLPGWSGPLATYYGGLLACVTATFSGKETVQIQSKW